MPDVLEMPSTGDSALDTAIQQQAQTDPLSVGFLSAPVPAKEEPKVEPKVEAKPAAKEAPKPEVKPTDKPKVEAKPADKKPVTGDPLSKLDAAAPKPTTENEDKAQSRWMELKAAEKERNELKPKFDALQRELEATKAKLLKEEDLKHYESLKVKERAWEVENTPEWRAQITVPFQQREDYLNRMSQHYGIDKDALWSALDLADPFARGEKLDEVLKSGEKEVPSNVAAAVSQISQDLQVIYGQMDAHRKDAMDKAGALDSEKSKAQEAQERAEAEAYQTESADVYSQLEKKMTNLFGSAELLIEGQSAADAAKGAVPGDTPRAMAYQAMAGELLPFAQQRILQLETELATYKQEEKDRQQAQPGMEPTAPHIPGAKDKNVPGSLEEAIAQQKKFDPTSIGMG